jgi:O-antigen/teichoic acid export membrane protein
VSIAEPDVDLLDSGAAGGRAIRGGGLRMGAYVIAMLLSLASVPFMTRHLGVVDYGYFVTVSSIIFIIGGVTEAGLTNLGTREYVVLEGARRERFLRNLVGLRLTLTITGIAVAVAFTAVSGAEPVIVVGTLITGFGLLLALTQSTYGVPLSAQLRFGWVSVLELTKHATIAFSTIALVLAGAGLVAFFFTSVLGGFAMLVCTLAVLRREAGLLPALDVAEWRRILRDVLPYALASAVGLVYFRLAIILMSYISDGGETGIYGAAFRIVETVGVVPWLLVSSGFPILARAARDDDARLRYALQRLFDVSLLTGVWIALCLVVGAQFAVAVVAGPSFDESVAVLQILALCLLTSFLVATWSFALLSLKRFRQLLIANAVAAATAAALTFTLVPPLGAVGAALATLAAEAALAAGYLIALARVDRALVPKLGQLPRLAPATAGAAAAGLLVPLSDVPAVILATVVYFALAFALRAVPPELVNAALRRDPGDDR